MNDYSQDPPTESFKVNNMTVAYTVRSPVDTHVVLTAHREGQMYCLGTRTPLVGAQDRCSALCEQNKGGVWTSWDGRTQCVCAPLPQGGAR